MTLYREHFTDENELPKGEEGWIYAGTCDEFGVLDRWMVPVKDERLTRVEWEATINYEKGETKFHAMWGDASVGGVEGGFAVAFKAAVDVAVGEETP